MSLPQPAVTPPPPRAPQPSLGATSEQRSRSNTPGTVLDLEQWCTGVVPLRARLEPWQIALAADPPRLEALIAEQGSPLHLHRPDLLERNLRRLASVAELHAVPLDLFFARKANKCLSYVEKASRAHFGIDLASLQELEQALALGVEPQRLVLTAAVKPRPLLERCIERGVLVVLDNADEVRATAHMAHQMIRTARVGLRVRSLDLGDATLPESRFGVAAHDVVELVRSHCGQNSESSQNGQSSQRSGALRFEALHFHLDGYDPAHRVAALDQCLELADELAARGQRPRTIDMGGGIPMNYQASAQQWRHYWQQLELALRHQRPEITYRNHGFGQFLHEHTLVGPREAYPLHGVADAAAWLHAVLGSARPSEPARTIAAALRESGMRLACEPGRAVLDGCGATVARVEHRKAVGHDWHLGLCMNGSQCRSKKSELFVDPLLVPSSQRHGDQEPIEGYLCGAYCTESDLILHRKLRFPRGVEIGDLILLPNTAGYLMHFVESRSHQFPLARNVVLDAGSESTRLDPIDQ